MKSVVLAAALLAAGLSTASAASAVTFVASYGIDSNACSRGAPCRTFQAALAQTLPGGTISAVDAADYGPVAIDKAVNIEGHGFAMVGPGPLANPAVTGIAVDAGPDDAVSIRGVGVEGAHLLYLGIKVMRARSVSIEDVTIRGINRPTASAIGVGIQVGYFNRSANAVIRNVAIHDVKTGLAVTSGAMPSTATVDRVAIDGATHFTAVVNGPAARLIASGARFVGSDALVENGGQIHSYKDNLMSGVVPAKTLKFL